MINESIYRSEDPANPDEAMTDEFKGFIDNNGFTADQIRQAYYRLLGITENNKPDPVVEKILAKMEEMAENKFPINRLAELIGAKQKNENAVPNYYQYVESLNISSKEKRVLRSIVEENRSGEVECLVDGEVVDGFNIKKMDEPEPTEALAEGLVDIISKIMERIPQGKKCEFMFMED